MYRNKEYFESMIKDLTPYEKDELISALKEEKVIRYTDRDYEEIWNEKESLQKECWDLEDEAAELTREISELEGEISDLKDMIDELKEDKE